MGPIKARWDPLVKMTVPALLAGGSFRGDGSLLTAEGKDKFAGPAPLARWPVIVRLPLECGSLRIGARQHALNALCIDLWYSEFGRPDLADVTITLTALAQRPAALQRGLLVRVRNEPTIFHFKSDRPLAA